MINGILIGAGIILLIAFVVIEVIIFRAIEADE